MQKLISLIITSFMLVSLIGQTTDCFEATRALGLQAYYNKHYTRAMDVYLAAYLCPDCPDPGQHDLEDLIRNAQQAQLTIYKSQVITAKQAEQTAVDAQKNEKTARKQAEESEEKAKKSGRLAESLRLSLLADIERRKKNYSDALPLAFYSILLSDTTNAMDAMIVFSKVIQDSFIQYIPVKGDLLELQNHPQGITTLDDNGFTLWSNNDWQVIHNVAAFNQQFHLDESVVILGNNESNIAHLSKIDNTASFLLDKHTEPIKWMTSSSNYYLSCSRDNDAILWDEDGISQATLSGHKGNIYQGIITDTEENIITRSSDGSVKTWTIEGELIATINTGSVYISCMAIDSNQGYILLGDGNGNVSLWNKKGAKLQTFNHGDRAIKEVVFMGENSSLKATLSIDGSLKIWNESGEVVLSIPNVEAFGYLANNNTLYTRHPTKGIQLWSLDKQKIKEKAIISINDFSGTITAVDFNNNENALLSTNSNGTINLWTRKGVLFLSYKTSPNPTFPALFSDNEQYFFCFDHIKSQIEIIPHPIFILEKLYQESNDRGFKRSILKKYNIQFLKN